jgi:hypothetical protein
VPNETTAGLARRWADETQRRFTPGHRHCLAIALGLADIDAAVTTVRSRVSLASVLDSALSRGHSVLVVGPPPGRPVINKRVEDLSWAFEDVTTRRGLTYVDTFNPLVAHDQWIEEMDHGDGRLPSQNGYGLLAWLALHNGWEAWVAGDVQE